jgi:hypothetical protein
MQRLESEARSLFLLEDRPISEVRVVIARFVREWGAFVRSGEPWRLTGFEGPHASEHSMAVWDLVLDGVWTVAAGADEDAFMLASRQFLSVDMPASEIGAASVRLARWICLLRAGPSDRAEHRPDVFPDSVLDDVVGSEDAAAKALRGISSGDEELVRSSLDELAQVRSRALDYAVTSGLMLRSALPARLALEAEGAALLRMTRLRGIEAGPHRLTDRALALWQLT